LSGSEIRTMSTETAAPRGSGRIRHVLSALVQNQPGVLAHISGMLASRGFNIDSLAVGETETPDLSRITFVVMGDDRVLEQVRKQLEKIVTVVRVIDISREDFVERDLMLLKVDATLERRSEIRGLVHDFRGRIVDIGPEQLIVEIAGTEKKIEAFIELMRPYGIRELARTGRIALVRSSRSVGELSTINKRSPNACVSTPINPRKSPTQLDLQRLWGRRRFKSL
jgi:acetolactate synthase-1/3 small subunit